MAFLLVLLMLVTPAAYAQESHPVSTVDAPVLRPTIPPASLDLDVPDEPTYTEKHPVIMAPVTTTKKLGTWLGRTTKTNRVCQWAWTMTKKGGAAVSDAVVKFGAATEKYHPAMTTLSLGSSIALPVFLRLIPRQ